MKRQDKELIRNIKGNPSKKDLDSIKRQKEEKKSTERKKRNRITLFTLASLVGIILIITLVVFISNTPPSSSSVIDEPDTNAVSQSNSALVKTSQGDFTIELYPEQAPMTVENFKIVIQDGLYNGSFFHRVVKGSLIECAINEDAPNRFGFDDSIDKETNNLSHEMYMVAASAHDDTNNKKGFFYILSGDQTSFDGADTVFGKITSGFDVVDAISSSEVVAQTSDDEIYDVQVGELSKPKDIKTVEILSIELL
ncbi:MAG TPA: peptidylprolyl isomerase [Caldisericia bacterium]|nr:peptidylprolyl isomerase [Caldisericia bacterium]HPF48797.1 peptidylprolyl isomerase [Caldisericia bacterium]HPI84279.1 peptidylprolyl isomerase [Caldisericia bacterium]HPQ93457.1 peptidylprolyl isomerase [Caldisericia bacterium]HRV74915.1 peptidylprolyl isomerase [Caldisericia bacterium]